jgi:rod shape determining protein RodA
VPRPGQWQGGMARRSWRNFDYILLGVLLILSAFGATMIYSATIDTLGVENPVQRQIVYILVGAVLLLVTASVDYRLLDIVQHPFSLLAPMVLGLASVAVIIGWRAGQLPVGEGPATPDVYLVDFPAMILGVTLVAAVFLLDRAWIEELDLQLPRALAVAVVIAASATGVFLLRRLVPDRPDVLTPYLLAAALSVVYLLDCLTLRASDLLRNVIYVLVLGMLGIIFLIGQVAGGAQRWLGAGAVQPSELSKLLVIVVLAKFLADREDRLEQFSTVLTSIVVVAVPMLLIYLQPDLGTALTLVAVWAAMMWMAGMRLRHLLILSAIGLAVLPLAWFGLEEYMRDRLLLFVNPASDPDSYFNVHQALVSIGSGGWTGKGLTHGTQSQLHFLRVRHTDFIFAVTAEELGFLGAVVLICLIFLLLWRILRVAERSRDTMGRLISAGVGAVILFQTAVNVGMNLGLMPVTGIPLPFVSYGGSSFITLMLSMGLVESVAMRHKKLEFD